MTNLYSNISKSLWLTKSQTYKLFNLAMVALITAIDGCGDSKRPKNTDRSEINSQSQFNQNSIGRLPNQAVVARLNVNGTDGTAELQRIFANELTQAEAIALGLGVVLTGGDTYAARIRVSNTGTVPIHFFPENLAVHFGGEAVGVTTINHPKFLQRGVLQPNRFFEGLVMYRARIDIGAAMRLAGGGLSYNDDTIEVTYNR